MKVAVKKWFPCASRLLLRELNKLEKFAMSVAREARKESMGNRISL